MPPSRKFESNPAQRLYDLLEKHGQVLPQHGSSGLWAVWQAVLEVPDEDLLAAFASAFSLIGQIDQALRVTGDRVQRRSYQIHVQAWRRAFLPDSSGVTQAVNQGDVSEVAHIALGGIASHLRDNLPEGRIPDEGDLADLREEVNSSIEALMGDDAIPMILRDLLLRRLHDVLWAVDHVATMGAGGLEAACDRLAMALVRTAQEEAVKGTQILTKLKDVVIHGYAIVGFGETMYGGYEAILAIEPHITRLLGA